MRVEFVCWNCKKENVYEHTDGETIILELDRREEHKRRQEPRVRVRCANCDLENKVKCG